MPVDSLYFIAWTISFICSGCGSADLTCETISLGETFALPDLLVVFPARKNLNACRFARESINGCCD